MHLGTWKTENEEEISRGSDTRIIAILSLIIMLANSIQCSNAMQTIHPGSSRWALMRPSAGITSSYYWLLSSPCVDVIHAEHANLYMSPSFVATGYNRLCLDTWCLCHAYLLRWCKIAIALALNIALIESSHATVYTCNQMTASSAVTIGSLRLGYSVDQAKRR